MDPLNRLKDKILGGKSKFKQTELTDLLSMVREFSCLGELLGRDFEVRNPKGELVYKIRQKPIAMIQMNKLMKEFEVLKRRDNQEEAAKWGSKKGMGRLNKRR